MEEKFSTLIVYGLSQISLALGIDMELQHPEINWGEYEKVLGGGETDQQFRSILSLVQLDERFQKSDLFYAPQVLTLNSIMNTSTQAMKAGEDYKWLYKLFMDEWAQIEHRHQNDISALFLSFYYLFRKYAWSIPGVCVSEGISLFEQWKAIAGLVISSDENWKGGPNNKFTLIGGDIPGIQEFVYTITSKGAAKGLRGRSFFIQLLGEAVIQRILKELDLHQANVIYSAGGNFMILAPNLEQVRNGEPVEDKLRKLRTDIERSLLSEFHGDLALSLAWRTLSSEDIGKPTFSSHVSRLLKEEIAVQKRSRFSSVSVSDWENLFGPQGKTGNRYCSICQTPLAKSQGTVLDARDIVGDEEQDRVCDACHSFGELAKSLGRAEFLSLGSRRPQNPQKWQEILFKVSNDWFILDRSGETSFTLNDTAFINKGAQGFRFVANVTPHITEKDLNMWDADVEGERKPDRGDVRTFNQIASDAMGIKNIGVLRMDVDNLGFVMVKGLKNRNLAATSALSTAIEIFFSGHINNICRDIERKRPESMYIIYSGGDDLFVIGAWDLMIPLAEKIRADFSRYTGNNPSLTISGAVTLEGRKFPLYQAAYRAGDAEDKAKAYQRNNVEKNAFHFLGMEVGWEEWEQVKSYRHDIETALGGGASKALIKILQRIYVQYKEQTKTQKAIFGPWIWRGAYALSRMGGRVSKGNQSALDAINRLKTSSLQPTRIHFAGLAARWVELLNR